MKHRSMANSNGWHDLNKLVQPDLRRKSTAHRP
jgi:hypothetical protein